MKQIFIESDLIGKTIKDAIEDDQFILIFEDNTFAIFHSYESSEYVCLSSETIDLTPTPYNLKRLVKMGLFSAEEVERQREIQKQKSLEVNRNYELEQLRKLKGKYPNS